MKTCENIAMCGLEEKTLHEIIQVLFKFSSVTKAIVFGSRAKGTFKKGSDIDIALFGESLTHDDITGISMILNEETLLPWKFDIIDYKSITNNVLREHIDRVGIIIYEV